MIDQAGVRDQRRKHPNGTAPCLRLSFGSMLLPTGISPLISAVFRVELIPCVSSGLFCLFPHVQYIYQSAVMVGLDVYCAAIFRSLGLFRRMHLLAMWSANHVDLHGQGVKDV